MRVETSCAAGNARLAQMPLCVGSAPGWSTVQAARPVARPGLATGPSIGLARPSGLIRPCRHIPTLPRPVAVEELPARAIYPLVGVRAEVVALRLDEVGRLGQPSAGLYILFSSSSQNSTSLTSAMRP